ncbi:MAG: type II toxin-antitoxin system RelE/ParE family toxin [Candidatus Desulforudis sp.]|nr:type II toxin-antitoxin system RelE/ParE family toxin [Desulforudis sp.]
MEYSFHPEAQAEFIRAIEYYEECEKGLGYDFAVEVYAAVERAAAYPKMWPFVHEEIRRCLVRRFPCGILYYYVEGMDEALILAVMHLHRDPDYWKHRT